MENSKPNISVFTKAEVKNKESTILEFCRGKKVLDVGCIGQDKPQDSADWLHKSIKSVTSELTGADINEKHIKELNQKGYSIFTPDELVMKGNKFDVVVMGDVIEHVDDATAFLKFYLRFLNDGGKLIITTPNPFSIRQTASIFLYGQPGINPEHTSGFDPITLSEIFARLSLRTDYFCWLHEYSMPKKLRYKFLYPLFRMIYSVRKYYSPNFLFAVSR